MKFLTTAGLIFALACAPAWGSIDQYIKDSSADIATFLEFLEELQEKVEAGDPRTLNAREMQRFNEIQAQLERMLTGKETVEELRQSEQRTVFNLQEELGSLLIGRDEDRVVCRRRGRVGTHFRETHCQTMGEIRAEQERGRDYIRTFFLNNPMPENN